MKIVYAVFIYGNPEMTGNPSLIAIADTMEKAQEIKHNRATFGGHIKMVEYILE